MVEYRLVHSMLNPGFVPHRVEFDFAALVKQKGIMGLLNAAYSILTKGTIHVDVFYSLFVIPLLALYFFKSKIVKHANWLIGIVATIIFIGLLFGLTHSDYYSLLTNKIAFLKTFQIDRFYTLLPFLFFLTGIICVQKVIENYDKHSAIALKTIIVIMSLLIFFNNYSIKAIAASNKKINKFPSYKEYYDCKLYNEVKSAINSPVASYRVVGVGVCPEVLQFNGFYTLDAYLNLYPLSYKKQFRDVIAGELNKSEEVRKYFDCWGNRCYVFSAELGYQYDKQTKQNEFIDNLNINTQALKGLCNTDVYIISTKTINNSSEIGLEFIKEFKNNKAYRDIVLYKVL